MFGSGSPGSRISIDIGKKTRPGENRSRRQRSKARAISAAAAVPNIKGPACCPIFALICSASSSATRNRTPALSPSGFGSSEIGSAESARSARLTRVPEPNSSPQRFRPGSLQPGKTLHSVSSPVNNAFRKSSAPPPSKSRWLNLKAIRHSPPPSMTRTASAARGGSGSSA